MLGLILLSLVANSALSAEVCYPPCGCFYNDPPFDDRPLPDSWEDQEIIWRLYTPDNPNIGQNMDWDNIPDVYDPSRRTVFIIHGWVSDPNSGNDASMNDIKDAFLENDYDYNVIVVNWSEGAGGLYNSAKTNTRVVGACSGHLADVITDVADVHCIGHSLGGHTCGYMGEFINDLSGLQKLGRITGMDPAGPDFEVDDTEVRLDEGDAEYVDVLHTNCNTGIGLAYGTELISGHTDFFPNNGGGMPGCATDLCDHWMAVNYMRASIVETEDCVFLGYPCDSYSDANLNRCNTCNSLTTCGNMGYYSDTYPGRGRFYLETNGNYPYCQDSKT